MVLYCVTVKLISIFWYLKYWFILNCFWYRNTKHLSCRGSHWWTRLLIMWGQSPVFLCQMEYLQGWPWVYCAQWHGSTNKRLVWPTKCKMLLKSELNKHWVWGIRQQIIECWEVSKIIDIKTTPKSQLTPTRGRVLTFISSADGSKTHFYAFMCLIWKQISKYDWSATTLDKWFINWPSKVALWQISYIYSWLIIVLPPSDIKRAKVQIEKLDGVGPVDNRPSTDKLHHYIHFFFLFSWHVTCDTWHVTCDLWHMTYDTCTWHTGDGEHCVKTSGP